MLRIAGGQEIKQAEVLILDDIGAEQSTLECVMSLTGCSPISLVQEDFNATLPFKFSI